MGRVPGVAVVAGFAASGEYVGLQQVVQRQEPSSPCATNGGSSDHDVAERIAPCLGEVFPGGDVPVEADSETLACASLS